MAYYLVEAAAKEERLPELGERLEKDEFLSMRPFGVSVTDLAPSWWTLPD